MHCAAARTPAALSRFLLSDARRHPSAPTAHLHITTPVASASPYSPPVSCCWLQVTARCFFLARRFRPHARNAARRSPLVLHCTAHPHSYAVRLVGLAVAPAGR